MASLSWDFYEELAKANGEPSSPKFSPVDAAALAITLLVMIGLLCCIWH